MTSTQRNAAAVVGLILGAGLWIGGGLVLGNHVREADQGECRQPMAYTVCEGVLWP